MLQEAITRAWGCQGLWSLYGQSSCVVGWQLKPSAVPSSCPGYRAANWVQCQFMRWGRKRESVAVLSSQSQLLSWGVSGTSELALQQPLLLGGHGDVVSLASA